MRIKDAIAGEGEEPYNLVPLTDMVFNLLIFFMCATTFVKLEKELGVQLPTTSASVTPLSAPPKQLIINIKQDGAVFVSAQQLDDAALGKLLSDNLRNSPDKEVLIRADERSIFKHYAKVVSVCRKAGVKESKLGYLEEERAGVKVEP